MASELAHIAHRAVSDTVVCLPLASTATSAVGAAVWLAPACSVLRRRASVNRRRIVLFAAGRRRVPPVGAENPSKISPLWLRLYKVGIRPWNGLPLTKINPMHLNTAIAREAGIPNSPSPFQPRIDTEQNVIVVSTPSPAIEKALETLQKISVGGNTYEVAVYPIAPDNSCKGVIYNIGTDCSVEEVRAVVEAPGYEVLTIRRLGSSSALAITFKGKKVPF